MTYDFYIAGPFFNEDQINRIKRIENCLDELGATYFSPRINSNFNSVDNAQNRNKVFKININNMLASNEIIAVTNDKDMGTLFEAGYFYNLNRPITYYFENGRDVGMNLMLSESANAVAYDVDDLMKILDCTFKNKEKWREKYDIKNNRN